ncbi:LysR family transcriptional regulator [Paenibacillus sp. S150]|uniref:LysR family transcriptional regulator n=1 Tax=Paenibacillus sp. S150 TaxID=2749826 RepID=UPI001C577CC5|nr:LysR family transcriptional regulator [Paenibacillus sp. S150]MBW4082070.1 LysR family transcriptional regulator [Paenibacillus sp. S150]
MELPQLEYFQCVARTEHMTRAAELLSVSQSALSRSIARMEAELGVPLFERQGRTIRLNRYGELFLKRVNRILKEYETGKLEIQNMVEEDAGEVNLGFLHTMGSRLIPDLISTYRVHVPNIRFQLHQNHNTSLLQQLIQGSLDLCLLSSFENMPIPLQWVELWSEELFVAARNDHPLSGRESIELKEIATEPMITFKPGYGLRSITDRLCMEAGFIPDVPFEGEEVPTVAGLVAAGLGVSLIPDVPGLDSSLVKLRVSMPECRRIIGVAWVNERYMAPAARRFLEYIIKNFQNGQEPASAVRQSTAAKLPYPGE